MILKNSEKRFKPLTSIELHGFYILKKRKTNNKKKLFVKWSLLLIHRLTQIEFIDNIIKP